MNPFDELGLFWLPGQEENALSGRLQFDPTREGISLRLVGSFDSRSSDHDNETQRIIGWRGNDRVTLDQCLPPSTIPRAPGIGESVYHANRMFVGHHFEEEELAFQSASMQLSDLDSWVGRSGIAEEYPEYPGTDSADQPLYRIGYKRLEDQIWAFSRGQLKLAFDWKSNGDPVRELSLKQWPILSIEYDKIESLDIILKDLGRLQDLLTLCIDAPTIIDRLVLRRPDIKVKLQSGSDTAIEQPVDFVARQTRYISPQEREPRHWHQMLLSFDELGGLKAAARWLDASQRFQRALDSFISIKHAEHMFGENRFLNVTFAAEAFHRITAGGLYMEREAFESLLATYLEHTPKEHEQWFLGRMKYANELSLRKRLQQLAERAGEASRPLIGAKGRWVDTIVRVRNELTHLAGDSRAFSGSDLIFLTESVYAIVRLCMLMESGVSQETLIQKATASNMTWYRGRLMETIEKVRMQIDIG